jgi:hypothetical protein
MPTPPASFLARVKMREGSWFLNAPEYAKKPVHGGEKML